MSYRRAAAAVTLIAGLSVAGYHGVVSNSLDQAYSSAQSELKLQTAAHAEAEESQLELTAQAAELDAVISTRRAVLAEREKFSAAIDAAGTALSSADGKVDVATQKERVIAAQNAVAGQLEDAELVIAQTAEVNSVAAEVTELVRVHDERVAEEARRKAAESNPVRSTGGSGNANPSRGPVNTGGGDWLGEMRSRLTDVGGGGYSLFEYDGNCGGTQASACAYSGRGIAVSPSVMQLSDSQKNWAMVHELAHMYQYNVWSRLVNSASYQNIFGGNIELLANCMASARGYTNHGHNSQCTAERLDYGRSIWDGIVP